MKSTSFWFRSIVVHRSVCCVYHKKPSRVFSLFPLRVSVSSLTTSFRSSRREPLSSRLESRNWKEDPSIRDPASDLVDPVFFKVAEILETFFLLTSIVLQLVPVIYKFNQKRQEKVLVEKPVVKKVEKKEEVVMVPVKPIKEPPGYFEYFPLLSFSSLLLTVVLGIFLRRFDHGRRKTSPVLEKHSLSFLSNLDRDELEEQMSRAFGEISQLVGQVERLRMKVRLLSTEYNPIIESTAQDSSRLKAGLLTVGSQIKEMDKRFEEVDKVLLKLEGIASKQFEIVSFALRRVDSEYKELKSKLSSSYIEMEQAR